MNDSTIWGCPECEFETDNPRRRGPHASAHTRFRNAKYRYLNGDTKHPYEFKACKGCGEEKWIQKRRDFCSYKCSQTGENNSNLKTENLAYVTCHQRVYVKYGPAICCSTCGKDDPNVHYEWANLTGDYENIEDYAQMCKPCHTAYDHSRRPDKGRRVYTEELLSKAEEMRASMTLTQVAETLGVAYTNLSAHLKKRRESAVTEGQ